MSDDLRSILEKLDAQRDLMLDVYHWQCRNTLNGVSFEDFIDHACGIEDNLTDMFSAHWRSLWNEVGEHHDNLPMNMPTYFSRYRVVSPWVQATEDEVRALYAETCAQVVKMVDGKQSRSPRYQPEYFWHKYSAPYLGE